MYNNRKRGDFGKKLSAGVLAGGTALGTAAQMSNTASAYPGERYAKKAAQTFKDFIFGKAQSGSRSVSEKEFVEAVNSAANRKYLGGDIEAKVTEKGILIKDIRDTKESKLFFISREKMAVYALASSKADVDSCYSNGLETFEDLPNESCSDYTSLQRFALNTGLRRTLESVGIVLESVSVDTDSTQEKKLKVDFKILSSDLKSQNSDKAPLRVEEPFPNEEIQIFDCFPVEDLLHIIDGKIRSGEIKDSEVTGGYGEEKYVISVKDNEGKIFLRYHIRSDGIISVSKNSYEDERCVSTRDFGNMLKLEGFSVNDNKLVLSKIAAKSGEFGASEKEFTEVTGYLCDILKKCGLDVKIVDILM